MKVRDRVLKTAAEVWAFVRGELSLNAFGPQLVLITWVLVWLGSAGTCWSAGSDRPWPYGLASRAGAQPYLAMPAEAGGRMPQLLSQVNAFADTPQLKPADSLIPYDLNVAFWSDGATKTRWTFVPKEGASTARIIFRPTGEWTFPAGTVFVKHFELATNETRPELKRRLETRLLVCDRTGGVYGVTYKWRADNSDAELLATNLEETISIKTATGTRTQTWHYPSRAECLVCHTEKAGGVLGVKTRQLNREFPYPNGVTENQLRAWNHAGLFAPGFEETDLPRLDRLARADDASRSLEDRARSYLDANCAHCHRPGGTVAYFDARYDTPLAQQGLIDGQILIDEGMDGARAIAPKDTWRSIVFLRASADDAIRMPPLAHNELDRASVALLRHWIDSLPGPPVLAPPTFSPRAGSYPGPIEVRFDSPEPGAAVHYTLDGSAPTKSDPIFETPIRVTAPTVIRARAFKPGSTRSITVQAVYIVGE